MDCLHIKTRMGPSAIVSMQQLERCPFTLWKILPKDLGLRANEIQILGLNIKSYAFYFFLKTRCFKGTPFRNFGLHKHFSCKTRVLSSSMLLFLFAKFVSLILIIFLLLLFTISFGTKYDIIYIHLYSTYEEKMNCVSAFICRHKIANSFNPFT